MYKVELGIIIPILFHSWSTVYHRSNPADNPAHQGAPKAARIERRKKTTDHAPVG